MPTLSPYVQVAATRYLEDPSNLAFVRNTVAQQSEKRVNTIASLVSGGRVSGVGRVTTQALSKNNDELRAIQEQRSAVADRAVKTRASAIEGYEGLTKQQIDVVKTYINQEAQVSAANAGASAVRDTNITNRFRSQKEAETKLLMGIQAQGGSIFGQISTDGRMSGRMDDAFRSLQSLNAGGSALDPAARTKILETAFGSRSELTGPERAVVRAAARTAGFIQDADTLAYPAQSDERQAADSLAAVDTELWQAYNRETIAANESLERSIKNRVGAAGMSKKLEGGTEAQEQAVRNTSRLLRVLSGVDPEAEAALVDTITQPLSPEDQKTLDKLSAREAEIESQDRIMLLGDAKSVMRLDPTLRDQVKDVVTESSAKRAAAVKTDDSLTPDKKEAASQKVAADRTELLRKADTAHGRRLAAGLMREGRRAGRGALGAEVKADGTIVRDAERKITLPEGVEPPTTGQEHRRVMQTVAGFGQGGAQQVFSRPKPVAPAASAPAAESEERSAEAGTEAPKAPTPAPEVTAINRQKKVGTARTQGVLARLAALRGDTSTA